MHFSRRVSPWTRRLLFGFLAFFLIVMCVLMLDRARRGSGQYDDFTEFSRDLVFNQINVYQEYVWNTTTIGKYPPFFAAVYAPLVPLPTLVGAAIWFWLNVGLSVWICLIGARTVARLSGTPEDEISALGAGAWSIPLALSSGLLMSNIQTSQVNIVLLALIVLALSEYSKRRDTTAGLLLGTAAAVKLTPGLFMAYFAWKRQWKLFAWSVVGVAICWGVLVPLMLGPSRYVEVMGSWLDRLLPFVTDGAIAEGYGLGGFRHTNQSMSAVVHRFLTETPVDGGRPGWYLNVLSLSRETASIVVKALSLIVLAALAWITRAAARGRRDPRIPLEIALVGIATLLLSPISWINHYVILTLAYLAVVRFILARKKTDPIRRTAVQLLVVSTVLIIFASRPLQAMSFPFFGMLVLAGLVTWGCNIERRKSEMPHPVGAFLRPCDGPRVTRRPTP
jgi:alpha-1,2-mannosyltransferase